jgi:NAD(P)-dependent dehydrogenase (short-subunit alcohol dehydrogenase family)
MSYAGKTVLVTGGSRGIGAACAEAFAIAGANVVAVARSFDESFAPGGESGRQIAPVVCDVTDENAVAKTVGDVIERFGAIDVLVNNAGSFRHYDTFAVSPEDWNAQFAVNVRAMYTVLASVYPQMARRGAGSIVNLSSNAALPTVPGTPGHDGLFTYALTKAAVDRMTTYLAEEMRPAGVAVNGLRPGGVLTPGWREADPVAYEDARTSGRGIPCRADAVGPPFLFLGEQTPATMTGRTVAAREFGQTWGPGRELD